jgi:L-asparaginase II
MGSVSVHQDAVLAERDGIIENTHLVHASVVDSPGKVLFTLGNPDRLTLCRSAIKPAQSLAVLETGAFDRFGFDMADLALMSASHNSEEKHLSRARAMLEKVQAKESDLRCGGHPSISPTVNKDWIRKGIEPSPVCNNCSGKHAGMLGGARALDADLSTYHHIDHPLQQRVRRVVEDLSELPESEVKWAIDGCNLPAPALSLTGMARLFASFAQAADLAERGDAKITDRELLQAKIFTAMTQHADMVGGEGRFCTTFMQAFQGLAFGKAGADGFYGVGVRESPQTRSLGAQGCLGIAVKIEDGNLEILYTAIAEILSQLEIGSPEMREKLSGFHDDRRFNTSGVVVGKLTFDFSLTREQVGGEADAE